MERLRQAARPEASGAAPDADSAPAAGVVRHRAGRLFDSARERDVRDLPDYSTSRRARSRCWWWASVHSSTPSCLGWASVAAVFRSGLAGCRIDRAGKLGIDASRRPPSGGAAVVSLGLGASVVTYLFRALHTRACCCGLTILVVTRSVSRLPGNHRAGCARTTWRLLALLFSVIGIGLLRWCFAAGRIALDMRPLTISVDASGPLTAQRPARELLCSSSGR